MNWLYALGIGLVWFLAIYHWWATRQRIRPLLRIVLWGGFLCTSVVGIFEVLLLFSMKSWHLPSIITSLLFGLLIGFIEEGWKLITTKRQSRRNPPIRKPIDPIVYALFLGLGFSIWENIAYIGGFAQIYPYGKELLIGMRGLVATPMHLTCAALAAYGWSLQLFIRPDRSWYRNTLPWWGLAMLLHGMYDGITIYLAELPLSDPWDLIVPSGFAAVTMGLISIGTWRLIRPLRQLHARVLLCPMCYTYNPEQAATCQKCLALLGNFIQCHYCGQTTVRNHNYCAICGIEMLLEPPPPIEWEIFSDGGGI